MNNKPTDLAPALRASAYERASKFLFSAWAKVEVDINTMMME